MEELDRIPPKAGQHPKTTDVSSKTRTGSKSQAPLSQNPDEFSEILSQRLKPSQSLEGVSTDRSGSKNSSGLPELQAGFKARSLETQAVRPASMDPARTDFIQKLEGVIQDLETYASWLSDPEKSLKQIQGLLQKMKEGLRDLAGEPGQDKRHSPDPDLTGMVSSIEAIVETEQIKMDRGDYLS